jgi:hypothetical protein
LGRWFEQAQPFSGGLAAVFERDAQGKGAWGYIDPRGATVIPPQFDGAGQFHEGLAVAGYSTNVPVGSGLDEVRLGYLNDRGTWTIEPRFASAEPFEDGLAWVRQGDREGYVDITGTWVYSQPYVRSGKGNE